MYSFLSPNQTPTNPGRERRFSETQAKEIRRLYDEEKWSYRALARRFNCHRSTVCNVILGRSCYSSLGERKPRPKPAPITEEEVEKIRKLYVREDWFIEEIAKELGRNPQSIRYLINFYDW